MMELTKSEMQIMNVLWAAGRPLSRAEIIDGSQDKTWKDSSIHILLNGMLKKGLICESGFVKCSKTYGRTFAVTMTREEYYACAMFSHSVKPDVAAVICALLQRDDITPEQKQTIREAVAKL